MMGQVPTQKEDYFENMSRGSLRIFYNYLDYKTGLKNTFKSIRSHLLNKSINQKAWHELHTWFKDKHKVDKNKIIENASVFLDAIIKAKPQASKGIYMKKVTITSSMGPGIKLDKARISG